jgi:hypothetical protein
VAVLRTLIRCLLALFLWIGVSGAASVPAAPASVTGSPQASQADLHDRLLDLLGVGICGDDDSDEDNILCGGDLLADLVSDPALLLMSRGTCSRLLEQLYNRQVCDPHKDDCGQMHHGVPPSPQGRQILVSVGRRPDHRPQRRARAPRLRAPRPAGARRPDPAFAPHQPDPAARPRRPRVVAPGCRALL